MKIWVVGRGVPTPENKMWGAFELEQAMLLARSGHTVTYIALTLSFFNRKDPRGMRIFNRNGVRIVAYSGLYFPGKLGIYWEAYEDRCWSRLFQAAADADGVPDIIHVHYPSMISSPHVVESYRRKGARIFATEHWSRVLRHTIKKHEQMRLQYYAARAACLACVGEPLKEAVQKSVNVTVPMKVIPNMVSQRFFEAASGNREDTFTFVAVGRLVPLKQFTVIAEQFIKTFGNDKRIRLKIIGSGSERKNLEHIRNESAQIELLGAMPLQEVARQIADADGLVSFSRYETFAAPVAEAWACGKPAIVSLQSGIASYMDETRGETVDADRPEELSAAMRRLYENRHSYDAKKISAFAQQHFSGDAILAQLNALYGEYEEGRDVG